MSQHKGTLSKLSRPRLSTVFDRRRLFHRIDESLEYSVIWICGAPGSGKTTLAASYIECKNLPSIWYQMDRADGEAASFFHYMTLAVSTVSGTASGSLPRIAMESLPHLPDFSLTYFRELFNRLKSPFFIVLDNYHEVPADSVMHELIKSGLEQIPDGINILILSRTPPPPAMARLIVNKGMMTIEPQELALTEQESMGIATLTDKWKPWPESVAKLHRFTQGWIAGLVLMLEYAEPEEATPISDKGPAMALFFDYFAGEVFNKMEPAVQQFLLKISCMTAFSPETAATITGFKGAGKTLAEMSQKNYFTLKTVQKSTFYQFHPLFKRFLRKKAEASLEPERLKAIFQIAADLCVSQGQLEDGFRLYTKIENRAGQARLIREHAAPLMAQGRVGVITRWLDALPDDLFQSDPWLLYIYGQCMLPFDTTKSRTALIQAYHQFKMENNYAAMALAVCVVVDTIITEWGDYKQLDPWIEVLDDVVQNHEGRLSVQIQAKAEFVLFLALMWRQPDHPYLKSLSARMFTLQQSDADPILRVMAGNYLLHYISWTGDMFQARLVIAITRELMKTFEPSPLVYVTTKVNEAIYQWFNSDLQGCLESVAQGLAVAERNGVHMLDNLLMAQEAYARLSLGDPASAGSVLEQMKPALNGNRHLEISHYNYLKSIYHLHRGDGELALRHIEEALRVSRTMGTPFPEGLNCITAAQIHILRGDLETAQKLNDRAKKIGNAMKSAILEMLSLFNGAYLCLKTGKDDRVRELLQAALRIEKAHNLVNFPTWRDDFIQELYEKALQSDIDVDYVQRQIRKRGLRPRSSSVAVENWPWRVRIYALGRFEIIVDNMPLVAQGKTQQKPLELMKALIALGPEDVAVNRLEDILWPHADGDRAHRALITTLHRLRKLTGSEQMIVLKDARMSLNKRHCWLDVWALEALCDNADRLKRHKGLGNGDVARLSMALVKRYRGAFLQDHEDLSWARPPRVKLRSRFTEALVLMARELIKQNKHDEAIALYLRGLEVDELAEALYQGLMTCYQTIGRITEGLLAYERCRETLWGALGTEPSPKTESIRKKISGTGSSMIGGK